MTKAVKNVSIDCPKRLKATIWSKKNTNRFAGKIIKA